MASILVRKFEIRIVGVDYRLAVAEANAFDPDVVVIDLGPGGGSLGLGRELQKALPNRRLLCLGDEECPDRALHVISTRGTAAELWNAICMSGRLFRHTGVQFAPSALEDVSPDMWADARLSHRSGEVIRLLVQGRTMKEVGRQLEISPRTVAFHKYQVMKANGLFSNVDLLRFAIDQGLFTISTSPRPSLGQAGGEHLVRQLSP